MSRRRPVDRQQIDDLYEDGLRYASVEYPNAAGVGCVSRDLGESVYSMVIAIDLELPNGVAITPRLLVGLPEPARSRLSEAVAVRACMEAHAEIDRSLADRPAP